MIVLPTNKVPATSTNPQYLVLYGLPKAGKTSAVAQLENNLIVDLEGGSKFITNYKLYTKKYKLPFILGKMYTLTDGTPIVFYDDEIQIGFDTYRYTDFADFSFLSGLKASTKKTIINIYTNGAAHININL